MEIVSKPRKFSVVKLVIGEIFFILHIVYVGVLDILHGMEKTLHWYAMSMQFSILKWESDV